MVDKSSTKASPHTPPQSGKLGIMGLTAIVFSSMIGGGIFNIAQNMAAAAGLGAIIISWLITAFGILFLVFTFKILADRRPDLNAGIYQYAQAGFGNYVGFNIAWGYWLCVALGNVAYAVMLNDSFGAFFPVLLHHGWPTAVFGIGPIWIMFGIVVSGVQLASAINTIMTIVKLLALVVIVAILIIFFKAGMFTYDFWGRLSDLGSLGTQIKSTMLVTLWCFIGIEGAVMMSSKAKKPSDVGKASVLGFYMSWALYALVSILCFGIMKQPEMAKLDDPSVAYVLKSVCGTWAYYFVVISVILSLLSSWVAWTLLCAQTPYGAASVKILPQKFMNVNKKGMPAFGLVASSIFMTIFMILVCTAPNVYMAALDLTSVMVLPAYFFSGLYLWKLTLTPEKLGNPSRGTLVWYRTVGIICTFYCAWLLYAGSLLLLLVTSLFYIVGTYFYIRARRQYAPAGTHKSAELFTAGEKWIFAALVAASIISIILLIMHKVSF